MLNDITPWQGGVVKNLQLLQIGCAAKTILKHILTEVVRTQDMKRSSTTVTHNTHTSLKKHNIHHIYLRYSCIKHSYHESFPTDFSNFPPLAAKKSCSNNTSTSSEYYFANQHRLISLASILELTC
jgi:hypothetical protein